MKRFLLRHFPTTLRLPLLTAAGVLLSCAAVSGQSVDAREEVRQGIDALARGDTTAGLAHFDRAIRIDSKLAAAHFHKGVIHAERASAEQLDFEDRKLAEQALEEAIRLDPGNPLYYLALGKLMLKQQVRLDARRVFARALEVAERADPRTRAETHYQLAVFHEAQWERLRLRHNLPNGFEAIDPSDALDRARFVWRMLERSRKPPPDQGIADRDAMLEHLRAALQADDAHVGASARMLAYLYEEGLMPEFHARAERAIRAAPDSAMPYLALGLGLRREGHDEAAARAFADGLARLPSSEREALEDLGKVLDRNGEREYASLGPAQKEEYRRRFWALADPFYLTPTNEYWLEFMARVTYAELRFSLPEYGMHGWDTDRGVIWIRYGAPVRQAVLPVSAMNSTFPDVVGQVTTIWTYGPEGPVFMFTQNAGYRRARFAREFAGFVEDYRSVRPAVFADAFAPERLPVPMQVARFRGISDAVEVEVHAALPLRGIVRRDGSGGEVPVRSGFAIRDDRGHELARDVRDQILHARTADDRVASWRTSLPPGRTLRLSVEAHGPTPGNVAVGRQTVETVAFPAGRLGVSDLLLGTRVQPKVAEPRTRADFDVAASPTLVFAPGTPIGVYYEIYNLVPDAEQYASYEVELTVTVRELYRSGDSLRRLLGELADRWGLTEEGGEAVRLRFRRDARVLARDLIPEHLRVELPEPPPGRYGLRVTVRDRNGAREQRVEREFEVRAITEGEEK